MDKRGSNLLKSTNTWAIIMDFEHSCINALKRVKHDIIIIGCFYHFKTNLVKQMRKKHVYSMYCNDATFEFFIKRLFSLAWLPPQTVVPAFKKILKQYAKNDFRYKNEVKHFVTYLTNTYFGKKIKNKTSSPKFGIEIWNKNYALVNGLPSTNNSLESFNGRYNYDQPGKQNLYSTIDGFKREFLFRDVKVKEIYAGKYVGRNKALVEETVLKYKTLSDAVKTFTLESFEIFFEKIKDYV